MLSDNGTSFTSRVLSSGTMDLVKVIAIDSIGSGVFVALDITNNKMVTSTDGGRTWAEVTLPETLKYSSVCYSSTMKKIFMVAKESNKVLVSSNGIDFITITLPQQLDYVDVVSCDNIGDTGMVAILNTSTSMMVSTNGTDWIEKIIIAPMNGGTWNAMCYNDKIRQLVVVGDKGATLISNSGIGTSIDSIVFTNKTLSNNTSNLSDVCYSNVFDKYCTVVSNNSDKNYMYNASNELLIGTWKTITMNSSSNWAKVLYMPFYKASVVISGTQNKSTMYTDEMVLVGLMLTL